MAIDYGTVWDALHQVNARRGNLLVTNTKQSCGEFIVELVTQLGGGLWGFVGKTAGESQYHVNLPAPLTGISYDAIFHLGENEQIDVLANASANEPGPWPKGPARLQVEPIPREHYRPNNPWVGLDAVKPAPEPISPPPPAPPITCRCDALEGRLEALEGRLELLRQVAAQTDEDLDHLLDRIKNAKIGTSFYHSHKLEI